MCSSLTKKKKGQALLSCHRFQVGISEQETDQILDDAAKKKNQECICSDKKAGFYSLAIYIYVRTFQLYVHCSYALLWKARQTRWADMPVLQDYKKKKDLLRQLYNAPIIQTTDFCSESQTKTEDIAGLISPIKQQAPTAGNTRLHVMNHDSILIRLLQLSTSSNRLHCINRHLWCLSLSCWLFLLCLKCTWTHVQYIVGTGKSPRCVKCVAGSPWNLYFYLFSFLRSDKSARWGSSRWDVEDRLLWVSREQNLPDTFQVSTCRASPINTPRL